MIFSTKYIEIIAHVFICIYALVHNLYMVFVKHITRIPKKINTDLTNLTGQNEKTKKS